MKLLRTDVQDKAPTFEARRQKGYSGLRWTAPAQGALLVGIILCSIIAVSILADGINFIAGLMGTSAFCATLGRCRQQMWLGVLVSDRNTMSLSRFQTLLWTLIIVSGYAALVAARFHKGVPDPLNVCIDWRLWTLAGISLTSYVGCSLILGNKQMKNLPTDRELQNAANQIDISKTAIQDNAKGTVYFNPKAADAEFTDIFEGDEIGNTSYIDITKVQMFFFTIVAAATYGIMIYQVLASNDVNKLVTSPPFQMVFSQSWVSVMPDILAANYRVIRKHKKKAKHAIGRYPSR